MNEKTFVGFAVAVIVLGLALSPLTQNQADAAMKEDKMMEGKMMDKMMKEPVSIRGDLTAPADDKPFGGDDIGNYLVRVKDDKVRIIAKVDKAMMEDKMMEDKMKEGEMMEGKVLEGWLVDMQSGYKLSTGKLEGGSLVFTQKMVNPFIYDLIVITEEPMHDTDPSPHMPVGGAQIAEPFGQ